LIQTLNSRNAVETFQLVNQLLTKYPTTMSNVVTTLAMPMITQLFYVMPTCVPRSNNHTSPTSDQVLSESLQKVYVLFVTNITSNNLSNVFLTDTSLPYLNQIFTTLLAACNNVPDPNVCKQVYMILKQVTEQWLGGVKSTNISNGRKNGNTSNGGGHEDRFPCNVPVKAKQLLVNVLMGEGTTATFVMLQTCVRYGYDKSDAAMTLSMHKEVIAFQQVVVLYLGQQYIEHVVGLLLSRLHLQPNVAQQYRMCLTPNTTTTNVATNTTNKQFRKFFATLMEDLNKRG